VGVEDQRHRVTEILRDLDLSDARQVESLLAIVYDELHALAARHLRGERRGHTLQPTAQIQARNYR
jgi:hypothetical protein